MIQKANKLYSTGKKVRILIAGYPGIGKTTIGLSAPKPLLIDADCGVDRVDPTYSEGHDVIQPKTYEDLLTDLTAENLAPYESIVIDTLGKLQDLMKAWAIRQDPKYGQRDGSLSLKGYGYINREMSRLLDMLFYEMNKNLVVLFHAVEDKDGDNTRLRLKCEGATKNNIWESMDLGGFVEMYGNSRTLGLSNCERYFAKGTRGVNGIITIPTLTGDEPNDFLTKLFAAYNARLASEMSEAEELRTKYKEVMATGNAILAKVVDAQTATDAFTKLSSLETVLTSRRELGAMFKAKVKELGLVRDGKVYKKKEDAAG